MRKDAIGTPYRRPQPAADRMTANFRSSLLAAKKALDNE
jgi:hypothetical protein